MPNTGTPVSYTPASIAGAPSTCTDLGPPLRMMPAGLRASISATDMLCGTISEYTCASRTRRAISWAYWAPKSTTRTVSKWSLIRLASVPHPDALGTLEALAFGLECGGDHDLGLLELLDRLVATRGHRG